MQGLLLIWWNSSTRQQALLSLKLPGESLECSLVPRPLPLMRRNGLVNQVKFLGVAHTFATV